MKYTHTLEKERPHARASLRNAPISTKWAAEMCRHIRHKTLAKAKDKVSNIAAMKIPLPLLKHNKKQAHRKGPYAAGRFPIKCASMFLTLLDSVEANARNKNIDTDNLVISHTNAQKASRPMHAGRQRGTLMKRTHVEIIVEERKKA